MNDSRPLPTTLWVVPVSDLGGVARHVLDVARVGLPGYRLVVCAPEGPLLERLRDAGTPVVTLQIEGRAVPQVVRDLRTTIRRLRPAVVHSHLAKADFLVAAATVGLPVRVISTEHHVPADLSIFHAGQVRSQARRLAHHIRIRRFDRLLAVSASTARDLRRHWRPTAPVTVVRNGVDPPRPINEPTDRPAGHRLLSLSRLAPEKNVTNAIEAFSLVHERHPDARLTVAGEGPCLADLECLVNQLGLGQAVSFIGFVDPQEVMAEHDVLVQASSTENLSYTLLDAVAAGMGVAATDVGGNAEILPEHCLAPLGDSEALAAVILEQAEVPGRRPTLPPSIPGVAAMAASITDAYWHYAADEPIVSYNPRGDLTTATPEVSVIIPCHRLTDVLQQQLLALSSQVNPPPFEVILADNEGAPDARVYARAFALLLDIRVVSANQLSGVGFARNAGADAARAEILAFCDSDDIVDSHWLRAITDPLREGNAVVGGVARLDRLNPEFAWRTYLGVNDAADVDRPVLQHAFTFLDYLPFVLGCTLAVRRETFLGLGGMNEALPGGSEDVEFSWRAIESGVPLIEASEAIVDYRLRTDPTAVRRQRHGYASSQLTLWAVSVRAGRPVRGMSLRWAITETAKLPVARARLWSAPPAERYRFAAWSGAVTGNLLGQLRERSRMMR